VNAAGGSGPDAPTGNGRNDTGRTTMKTTTKKRRPTMKRTTTRARGLGVVGVAAAALLLPLGEAAAQDSPALRAVHVGVAEATLHEVTSIADAARRYRAAAARQLDADAARSYVRAGHLAYEAGAWQQALEDLSRGAERAIAAGDSLAAASALVDAAWLSLQLRQVARAEAQIERMRDLLRHAAIPDGERRRLEHRLSRLGMG
jgi:hypothetical protein